jgi:hypothetical protein
MSRCTRGPLHLAGLVLVAAAGCTTGPSAPADPERVEAQARCRGIAYENRRVVGRGPPNWNFYDYCMRQFDARRVAATGGKPAGAKPPEAAAP